MKRASIPYEPATTSPHLNKLALNYRDLSMDEIRNRIKRCKPSRRPSIEKKMLVLKLLSLSGMHYTEVSRDLKISRRSLYDWQDQFGELVKTAEPEARAAEIIETSLAKITSKVMLRAYNNTDDMLEILSKLAKGANSIRHIHAIAEALQVTIEVIKLEKKGEIPPEKGGTFFQNIFNQMIQTTDNGNQG
jgi:hypothetical protein